ncbi:asparagine synthase-related protein [Candidatus Nitrosocosmicus sp. R]
MAQILKKDDIINFLTLRYNPSVDSLDVPLKPEKPIWGKIEDIEPKVLQIVKKDLDSKLSHMKVPRVSIALSGGIDSRFTLVMLRKFFPELKIDAICAGFGDDDDEISVAKDIAEKYNCEFHEIYLNNILVDLPKLISFVGTPKWNLYQFYTLEKAKDYSKIFYSGDGGDEIFGGYVFRYYKYLTELNKLKNPSWLDKSRIYLSCHERDWVPNQEEIFNKNLKFSWIRIYENFKQYFDSSLEPLDQVFLADFNGKLLYDWIPSNLKFGKHLDMDINSLFLNPEMIEFTSRLPWHIKYDYAKNVGKLPLISILKKSKGNGNIPAIKKGFSLNLVNMWDNYGKQIITAYLHTDSESVKNDIINIKWINESISLAGNSTNNNLRIRYISKLLSVLSFEIWYRIFISHTLKSSAKL